ncbi:MAG TPA: toxin-antitoxin system HicB family antitoxin [Terriglobia bacterium]|nr:toxin-antitoxin system HicB family antitoxin [Terriglobia bacterium]
MSTLSLRIPESLHRELRELARREGVSINQIISSAVGEKVASLKTLDYLRERASRGKRLRFEQVLAKVPDVEPEETDRLLINAPKSTTVSRRARQRRGRNR